MTTDSAHKPFEERVEERIRGAASQVEEDLRRVVGYINDEVMPDVRRNGSEALRFAAQELRKLAERIDAANQRTPPPPPPPSSR